MESISLRRHVRNRARLTLTAGAVAANGVRQACLRAPEFSAESMAVLGALGAPARLVTTHADSFTLPIPPGCLDHIRSLFGEECAALGPALTNERAHACRSARRESMIAAATEFSWFGSRCLERPLEAFTAFAVDPASYFDVFTEVEVTSSERQAFTNTAQGVLVEAGIAAKFGWRRGDRIHLGRGGEGAKSADSAFTVVGFHRRNDGHLSNAEALELPSFLVRLDGLTVGGRDGRRPERIGCVVSRLADGVCPLEASRLIDWQLRARGASITRTRTEAEFAGEFFSSVSTVLDVLSIASVGLLGWTALALLNCLSLTVHDRATEFSATVALGVGPLKAAAVAFSEPSSMGTLAVLLAVFIVHGLLSRALSRRFESELASLTPIFKVGAGMLAVALLAMSVWSSLSRILPKWSVARAWSRAPRRSAA